MQKRIVANLWSSLDATQRRSSIRPLLAWSGNSRGAAASSSRSGLQAESGARDPERVRLQLDTKVSESGSADALLQEAVDAVRSRRSQLELDRTFRDKDTSAITKLKQDELELTRKIFRRIDPTGDLTSNLSHAGHDIDPYWNPFSNVRELKGQVTAEFDEYSRYVSVAEAKRTKIQIKKSLRRMTGVYNPYSSSFRDYHERQAGDQPPKPFRLPDKYWEPSPLQVRLANEKITFRDIDIIQHFIADNGYILPRRTTMLSRKKQSELVKAVRIAQNMSLLPYKWKPKDYQAMPLTDPLQWTADRLTDRVREAGDRRSRAMLRVMMERYPELNYKTFLKHEADRKRADAASAAA
eukprot:TRINITY_DN58486_c0_g1_i1.p1 TRINITY_DN58486_c0_g1~~TRINITY_DN58486_c0_g1_i1.p1  ORF type:complete len:378 (+),score=56.17 TRINITY_DN58486_c0_g1_i1:77-1135(+)